MDNLITIGKIRTSHGVKGFIKVTSYSGEWDHFYKLESVLLSWKQKKKEFEIEEIKPFGKDELLIKLKGLDTPEAVKAYSGWDILVNNADSAPLKDGEVYVRDLEGCSLLVESEPVAVVKSTIWNTYSVMLEVEKQDGKIYLVPFHREYIGKVNTVDKTIELTAEWLLE